MTRGDVRRFEVAGEAEVGRAAPTHQRPVERREETRQGVAHPRQCGVDRLGDRLEPVEQETTQRRRLSAGQGVQDRPEVATSIRSSIAQYQAITAAELQAAARQYLVEATAWKMIVVPKAP